MHGMSRPSRHLAVCLGISSMQDFGKCETIGSILNANLDTRSVKILLAIFAGTKVITKPDVAHQAPQYLQPLLAFVPKAL